MSDPIGSFDDIVALVPEHEILLYALRDLIFELHPEAVEVSRPGDRAVSWGRALSTLGDLSRFPLLSALRVEDQLQLVRLDLTGASLERLWLYNCKGLADLPGLNRQERLREFRASVVALDMNALRDRDWPHTATSINLFSGNKKWNDDASAQLTGRGLGQKGDLWP
jgi:hypothetical protein